MKDPSTAPRTIDQALRHGQVLGLDRLDTQLLTLHALERPAHDRAWLLAHGSDILPSRAAQVLEQNTLRRAAGEPLAYITGHKEFFGLDLEVDARVLVPRPDTETLVEWAIEVLTPAPADGIVQPTRVLDLGTGSGAIALALKHQRADLQVLAVDFSAEALCVAQANARRLAVQVQFVQSYWMEGIGGPFELIVSNPPYIAVGDAHLPALRDEPAQALVNGQDGLDDIRQIVRQASQHLASHGWLLLEHGYDQAAAVRALLADAGLEQVQSRRDLSGIERCSGGRRPVC